MTFLLHIFQLFQLLNLLWSTLLFYRLFFLFCSRCPVYLLFRMCSHPHSLCIFILLPFMIYYLYVYSYPFLFPYIAPSPWSVYSKISRQLCYFVWFITQDLPTTITIYRTIYPLTPLKKHATSLEPSHNDSYARPGGSWLQFSPKGSFTDWCLPWYSWGKYWIWGYVKVGKNTSTHNHPQTIRQTWSANKFI